MREDRIKVVELSSNSDAKYLVGDEADRALVQRGRVRNGSFLG